MRTAIYLASVRTLEALSPARAARLQELLLPARREKLERLKNDGARRLSLGAGLLLSAALEAEGLRAADYAETEHGKPYIPSLPDFHFSLSHSATMVMCAVSARPLGCDIERVGRYDPRLAERFFHPEEYARLCALPPEERRDAFFRLWTLKESFMKATGLGFALPMNEFSVSLAGGINVEQTADARPWRFLSFREGEYFCALCAEDAAPDIPVMRAAFDDLR